MSKPIKPEEVVSEKKTQIPAAVFEGFNAMIAKHWHGNAATFTQDDVIAAILAKAPSTLRLTRSILFAENYLDVEDIYRAEGWHVEYDKPAYCEDYKATFTFRKRAPKS